MTLSLIGGVYKFVITPQVGLQMIHCFGGTLIRGCTILLLHTR